ncbi:MAG: ubiquinol oxidase subunit II [Stenotrophobium sp.]
MFVRAGRSLLILPLLVLLSGCNMLVLNPPGDIARQQGNLLIAATVLMLLIVVPLMLAIAWIAYRYRHTNKQAAYAPEWEHSTHVELLIWAAPLIIVVALGAMTWIGTHTLDPYRPIARISATQPLPLNKPALTVQVVAMDWKWLFLYPDYGIASVNQLVAPVDVPINFKITATDVMNSFYIPALAGQIMAMPAMETQLSAIINQPGDYLGFSANYSGAGFSDMQFRFLGKSDADFESWVQTVKSGGGSLGRQEYQALARPSENEPVRHYAAVDAGLYSAILNRCVEPGMMCLQQIMEIDAKGGIPLQK